MMSVFANQESLFIRSSMLRNRAETWVKDNKLSNHAERINERVESPMIHLKTI